MRIWLAAGLFIEDGWLGDRGAAKTADSAWDNFWKGGNEW